MNTKNENFTPRERVDADLLERLLRENDGETAAPAQAQPQPRPMTQRSAERRRRVIEKPCPYRMPRTEEKGKEIDSVSPAGWPLAMVYSPAQEFEDLYDAEKGLCRGTIFMQLDKPLTVCKCREGRWTV